MYKIATLSKIKPHFDAVDYLKKFPFIINPLKNQNLNI